MTHKPIITKAGSELPMLDLRGKPYLQVAHRVVWFREEHQNWTIETEQLTIDDARALFTARIKDETGRVLATATGSETRQDFGDFIEKAETKAIGRALAFLGYGTAAAPELDEGARIVDSPIAPAKFAPPAGPDKNAGKTAAQIAPPAIPAKVPDAMAAATTEQLTEIFALAKEKLAVSLKAQILPALNKEFGTNYKTFGEITETIAKVFINGLQVMKPLPKPATRQLAD